MNTVVVIQSGSFFRQGTSGQSRYSDTTVDRTARFVSRRDGRNVACLAGVYIYGVVDHIPPLCALPGGESTAATLARHDKSVKAQNKNDGLLTPQIYPAVSPRLQDTTGCGCVFSKSPRAAAPVLFDPPIAKENTMRIIACCMSLLEVLVWAAVLLCCLVCPQLIADGEAGVVVGPV
jgi:hypothetical protein